MYWHWVSAPPAVILGLLWVMTSPLLQQQRDVSDEFERIIGLLVPIVAALLSPLVAAIVLLFRQLVGEMRANREMAERLGRVVQANTMSSDASTQASNRLASGVEMLGERINALEQKDERRVLREQGA